MNAAKRQRTRSNWPRGLMMPRPGYFAWRHPDGRTLGIGRVPLSHAISEALAANQHLADQKPSLVERLTGADHTVADLLTRMDPAKTINTAKSLRSLDKQIIAAIGTVPCGLLTVRQCAELVEGIRAAGKDRSAQAVRSRLVTACRLGMGLGWMESNPAEVTRTKKVTTKRGRLTLETFQAIHAKAAEVAEWLPHAMMLALVTGADRVTITRLTRDMVADGHLTYQRSKTGALVAVPLRLRMDAVGVSLEELTKHRTGVVSRYLVHHVAVYGNAPAGSKVFPDRVSKAFTAARVLAGIPDEAAPTFHEIRSLAARLYKAQGGVDVQALLQHSSAEMTAVYTDPRGAEVVRVSVA
jgi:enterobacteria phage integrase